MQEPKRRGRPPKADSIVSATPLVAPELPTPRADIPYDQVAYSVERDGRGNWHLVRVKYNAQMGLAGSVSKTPVGDNREEAEYQFKINVAKELFGRE